MASERRLIDAKLAQHIANVELFYDEAGIVQWVLSHTPTVDAVEVVHGQWKNITDFGNGDCYGFCSACATEQHAQNASALKAFHRYCRWCGAKMDGERKDNG